MALATHVDYAGQKFAEEVYQRIVVFFAVIGLIWGIVCDEFLQTAFVVVAGFSLASLVTIPPWPIFRRNPIKFLPAEKEQPATTT